MTHRCYGQYQSGPFDFVNRIRLSFAMLSNSALFTSNATQTSAFLYNTSMVLSATLQYNDSSYMHTHKMKNFQEPAVKQTYNYTTVSIDTPIDTETHNQYVIMKYNIYQLDCTI